MQRRHWLAGGLTAVVLLGLAFILTGGVYRTVNAGGGRVYIVNRFTGRTRTVKDGVASSLRTEAQARRDAEERQQRRAQQDKRERAQRVFDSARASGAAYVGDAADHLYHRAGLFPLGDTKSDQREACLAGITGPTYFQSVLDATSQGYFPCQECLPSHWRVVTAKSAPVRLWPADNAPIDFTFARGDPVHVLGEHKDYYAVGTERLATGKRGVGWVAISSVASE